MSLVVCLRSIAIFTSACGAALLALDTQVVPDKQIQLRRVPMDTVFYDQVPSRPVHTPDFVFSMDDVTARGRDRYGKQWRAHLPAAIRGLWTAVWDGARTYFFAGYTGGAGMAPDSWVVALSFDSDGRPVPFIIKSSSAYDAKGIKDLLMLDQAGPVLLEQRWVDTGRTPHERGYYVTTAYCRRGIYWYQANGLHGSRKFPLYEKWAFLPNTQPALVAIAPDLPPEAIGNPGNNPDSGIRTRIVSVGRNGIHTRPELGCRLEFIDGLVDDSALGRVVEIPDLLGNSKLLQFIAQRDAMTTLTGLRRWPDKTCTASLCWSVL